MDIIVHTLSHYPEVNSPIKMEVGIEDCLHIEFEYNKSKYWILKLIRDSNEMIDLCLWFFLKISFERCNCGQNLFFTRENKD
jgi:hypothetical protein